MHPHIGRQSPWRDVSNLRDSTADNICPLSCTSCTLAARPARSTSSSWDPGLKRRRLQSTRCTSLWYTGGGIFRAPAWSFNEGTASSCSILASLDLGSSVRGLSVAKRIAQRLESSSHPSELAKQQPKFCSLHLAGTKTVPIPPASSSGDATGWTGSRPHRHAAAEPCAGRRMNLLPWQGEACVGLHKGFLSVLSHHGGPATTCPSSRRAGAAWQNPADREARAAPRPRARRCVSLPAWGVDPKAQGELPTTGSTPGDGKMLEAGAPSSAEMSF